MWRDDAFLLDMLLASRRIKKYTQGFDFPRFENDEVKLVDLANHLDGGIFELLMDISYFKSFGVNPDIGTVVMPNDGDFSPDFLYEIGKAASEPADAADG